MEIGDQTVEDLKFVAWIDENLCPATSSLQNAILASCRLQSTAAGGSDCDHTAAVFLGVVDQLRLVFFYNVEFRVHMMLLYIIHLNRPERAKAYMKGYMGNVDTLCLYLLQKLLRKMQACSRCCCGAFVLRINGLVAVLIL